MTVKKTWSFAAIEFGLMILALVYGPFQVAKFNSSAASSGIKTTALLISSGVDWARKGTWLQ